YGQNANLLLRQLESLYRLTSFRWTQYSHANMIFGHQFWSCPSQNFIYCIFLCVSENFASYDNLCIGHDHFKIMLRNPLVISKSLDNSSLGINERIFFMRFIAERWG